MWKQLCRYGCFSSFPSQSLLVGPEGNGGEEEMAVLSKCSRYQRPYMVIGSHSRTLMAMWICPRCKRGRNLPRAAAPENHPSVSSPTGGDLR